jgi:hypothetical protein
MSGLDPFSVILHTINRLDGVILARISLERALQLWDILDTNGTKKGENSLEPA